jgi:hypothetical protein
LDIPEVKAREDALADLRAHGAPDIATEQVESAIAAAEADRIDGDRTIGFGLILSRPWPRPDGGDWYEFVVAVSDGQRQAQIDVRLARSVAQPIPEDQQWKHVWKRLHNLEGNVRKDERYETVLRSHPLQL